MKSIIDTSTLISLARIAYLELVSMLRTDVSIPNEVYVEAVLEGEKKGVADSTVIKTFIQDHRIRIVRVEKQSVAALRKRVSRVLTEGDEAVLSLGLQERAKEIITDDDGLGKLATALGFDVKATPDLLMEGFEKNKLRFKDFEILVRGLVVENRLSSAAAELYILEVGKNVKG